MTKRWSATEKRQLLKMYATGNSFDTIGNILVRTPNAIKLRLEEIVYSNLIKGRKLSILSKMLKTDPDTIKQFYYSHKSFRQGKNKEVIDIDFNEYNIINQFNNNKNKHSTVKHKNVVKDNVQSGGNLISKPAVKDNVQSGGYLEKIENDNKFLEAIIKNHRMKKYVKKLYVDGKLDNKSIDMFNDIIKN